MRLTKDGRPVGVVWRKMHPVLFAMNMAVTGGVLIASVWAASAARTRAGTGWESLCALFLAALLALAVWARYRSVESDR